MKQLAATERRATTALLRALIELDQRRLYLREGYSSLFTYCTQALHLAEGAAYNRIEAARAARRFPAILPALEEGAVLTAANHQDVLASARHKGKREVEVLVASLRPRLPVPSTRRKLPDPRAILLNANATSASLLPEASELPVPVQPVRVAPRPTVTPLTHERYELQFTISGATHESGIEKLAPHDLRRTCARLCHLEGGELEQIQFLLGHVSVQTTERCLGCTQKLRCAVNDRLGIEPDAAA